MRGTAKGGAPAARVASYKVCTTDASPGSALLKAIDDAVSDGVDVISISIGMGAAFAAPNLLSAPVALGAFHAHQRGVLVVCSSGNDGPDPYTRRQLRAVDPRRRRLHHRPRLPVQHRPRQRESRQGTRCDCDSRRRGSLLLIPQPQRSAPCHAYQGVGINFSNQSLGGERYPMVFGAQAAARNTTVAEASNCSPGSLRARKVVGKILVCVDTDSMVSRQIKKLVAEDAGGGGWS
uniref:Cucumisin n=1 Tax=Aegilops tauschii TaxID=37682 RepID=M8AZH5_AEGTA